MPPKKGRKRRTRDRRQGDPGEARAANTSPAADQATLPTSSELPKLRVRMAGFVLAVVTLFVGILTAAQGVSGGMSANSAILIATGGLLIALAIVIGALTLVPDRVRKLLARK